MHYQTKTKRCLGIDPGLANCGWAVVSRTPSGKFRVLDSGNITTPASDTEAERALCIYQQISEVIASHYPHKVAIERVFFNKNVSSAITTGGVIYLCLLSAEQAGLVSVQVTPQQAKSAIGFACADKAQVQRMVEKLTGVTILNAHSADAVAIAIAGLLKARAIV